MRREMRVKLAKRRHTESERRSLDFQERDKTMLLRSIFLYQVMWLIIMMLKIFIEAWLNDFTFPEFWSLMYIWDDYIPIFYIFVSSTIRKYVTLRRSCITAAIFLGYLPAAASTLCYLVDVYYHTIDFGLPLLENYPLGMVWWFFLLISHFLRCKTIRAFLRLLAVWRLQQTNKLFLHKY